MTARTSATAAQDGPRATKTPPPPSHLREDGRAFWRRVLADYEITDAHDLSRLTVAAEALDRLAECRAAVERDGAFVVGRFGPKPHPALILEDRHRSQHLKAVRELALDLVEAGPTRPPSRWRGR